jgi:uncharacterized phage protein (TIGR02220 family)
MASRYHPLFGGLWSSVHLEGLPFEAKGFFAYLCSNDRLRPSGIYRVTDAQLAVDTGLPMNRVRTYLEALAARGRIVRDGSWIFVRGYLDRQPKHGPMLKGAENDVAECTSVAILKAFSLKYPHLDRWSTDRLVTLTRPINEIRSTDAVAVAVAVTDAVAENQGHPTVALPSPADLRTTAKRLLDFLNRKADKHYQADTNLDFIVARLKGGATEAQCRAIIGRKTAQWLADPKMSQYLRPATLFNKEKFAQYIGELPATAFETERQAHA